MFPICNRVFGVAPSDKLQLRRGNNGALARARARDTLNSRDYSALAEPSEYQPPKIRVLLVNMQFIIKLSIGAERNARPRRSVVYILHDTGVACVNARCDATFRAFREFECHATIFPFNRATLRLICGLHRRADCAQRSRNNREREREGRGSATVSTAAFSHSPLREFRDNVIERVDLNRRTIQLSKSLFLNTTKLLERIAESAKKYISRSL